MPKPSLPASNKQQQAKNDRLPRYDVNAMMKQILENHSPSETVEAKPLLDIIDCHFSCANHVIYDTLTPANQAHTEAGKAKADQSRMIPTNFDQISEKVQIPKVVEIAKMLNTCRAGEDAHASTMSLLKKLSNYSWDAKLVIFLAAFVSNYCQFFLLVQTKATSPLAKSMAMLKQLRPDLSELKKSFEPVRDLTKLTLETTKCIVDFNELPPQYIATDVPSLLTGMAFIPIAVYWTIRSILASQCKLTANGLWNRNVTTEASELSSFAENLRNIKSHLAAQLVVCKKHTDEMKLIEYYQNLQGLFQDGRAGDLIEALKALICANNDQEILFHGATKNRVNINNLGGTHVLLLISDLDNCQNELAILDQIYKESQYQRQYIKYEFVWLPLIDPSISWTEENQKRFGELQDGKHWYTVHHPSLINMAVIKFIKEVWHFEKKPILVVLDPQGRVASQNALHIIWIRRKIAVPLIYLNEEELWTGRSWGLQLLVEPIDPEVVNWIKEGMCISLYGGEDIDWIRKFTKTAREVAQAAGIHLEMVYVGKRNPDEKKVQSCISAIEAEKLSHCLKDIWFFWLRIESMLYSKFKLGKKVKEDKIMEEIVIMLTYDHYSKDGWAAIYGGGELADEMAKARGPTFLTCLSDYSNWEPQVKKKGFLDAFKDYLKSKFHPRDHNTLELPADTFGKIQETLVICTECGLVMEKRMEYVCYGKANESSRLTRGKSQVEFPPPDPSVNRSKSKRR